VEGVEALLDGLLVVVHSARGLTSLEQTLGHGLIADLKVQDPGTWSNFLFKLLALGNLPGITIDQESLGASQLLQHGLSQQVKHNSQWYKVSSLHDGSQLLASVGARLYFLSEQITRGQMGVPILGHNLVALGALATARATKYPDNGKARCLRGVLSIFCSGVCFEC